MSEHFSIVTIEWLLDNAARLPFSALTCLQPKRALELADKCAIFDGLLAPDEDLPPSCGAIGLTTTLGIQAVQMLLENLRQQSPAANAALKLRALNYFRAHDAYLDVSTS